MIGWEAINFSEESALAECVPLKTFCCSRASYRYVQFLCGSSISHVCFSRLLTFYGSTKQNLHLLPQTKERYIVENNEMDGCVVFHTNNNGDKIKFADKIYKIYGMLQIKNEYVYRYLCNNSIVNFYFI